MIHEFEAPFFILAHVFSGFGCGLSCMLQELQDENPNDPSLENRSRRATTQVSSLSFQMQ